MEATAEWDKCGPRGATWHVPDIDRSFARPIVLFSSGFRALSSICGSLPSSGGLPGDSQSIDRLFMKSIVALETLLPSL